MEWEYFLGSIPCIKACEHILGIFYSEIYFIGYGSDDYIGRKCHVLETEVNISLE